ncbi:cytochrome P450 [Athelia psychrophila]|uniref:Cytochrome P450 n=1 Tax=Athelia psychrophila TaxID=1759441 RepID=A0A166D6U7_9AGAM|nr:cytochrome P450 [Fibularhizoctonia sp. CBS 109695]
MVRGLYMRLPCLCCTRTLTLASFSMDWAGNFVVTPDGNHCQIIDIAYGIKTLPENDPLINMLEDTIPVTIHALVPGRFLVDTVLWLKDGTASSSFTANCLQNIDLNGDVPYQENIIENSASMIFVAGADTTLTTLMTFILVMMKHPEIQVKARLELNTVLGAGQLPSFGDEESLPYITAVVKECLRWQFVTPFAIHQSMKDDEAVLNDERVYADPFTFNPDRFPKGSKLNSSVRDPEAAFGFSRCICPDQNMTQAAL